MTSQRTLPSGREQAQHALLLLGAPAPARLVVEVHAALFDGDLQMSSLAALIRAGQQATVAGAGSADAYEICLGLNLDLTAVRGMPALAAWPLERRIVTPAVARVDALTMVLRVVEFALARPGLGAPVARLLRQLAELVPGGPEAVDVLDPGALAQAATEALAAPALALAVEREQPARAAAMARAARLEPAQQLFGVPAVPHQRDPS